MFRKLPIIVAVALCASTSAHAESLQEIYTLALENDHQLKADTAAYLANKEAYTIGRSALLPQISASASYSSSEGTNTSYQSFLNNGQGGVLTSDAETESNIYSVNLTQPLFNMSAWFGYQQGKAVSEQAEAQFGADQQALIIRTAEAYFNVLRAVDNLETAKAEEKALGHQLEQTQQRFDVGLTAITDVHEAQAAYDEATATKLQAQGNVGIAFEELEVLTGKSHDSVAPLVEKFPVNDPDPMDRHQWVEFALQNNYALKVAQLNSEAARQNARARSADRYPTVTANINYVDYNDTNTDVLVDGNLVFEPDSRTTEQTTIGVQLDVPIFTGMRTSGQKRQAHQQHMQAQELMRQTQRGVIQEARSLHLSVVTNVAQVKARRQAITSNNSALEATQAGYEVGTRNLVDVLVAQRNLYQAQRNYDNVRYDYVINQLRLKATAGNLTPQEVIELNRWLDSAKPVSRNL